MSDMHSALSMFMEGEVGSLRGSIVCHDVIQDLTARAPIGLYHIVKHHETRRPQLSICLRYDLGTCGSLSEHHESNARLPELDMVKERLSQITWKPRNLVDHAFTRRSSHKMFDGFHEGLM